MGSGVSGGEEGARYGPSLMPGGHTQAWPHIKDIFQNICATCEKDACCDWVGEEGAGHYVKMVHNGIEYGDMQVRKYRRKQGLKLIFLFLLKYFFFWVVK